jgi:hypothetical protein
MGCLIIIQALAALNPRMYPLNSKKITITLKGRKRTGRPGSDWPETGEGYKIVVHVGSLYRQAVRKTRHKLTLNVCQVTKYEVDK